VKSEKSLPTRNQNATVATMSHTPRDPAEYDENSYTPDMGEL